MAAPTEKMSFFQRIQSTTFQITSIMLASLYLAGLITIQYKRMTIPEKIPTLEQVDSTIRQLATPVTVGMHINSFPEFSINTGKFLMDAIIWFNFEKSSESIETISKFSIKNSILLGSFIVYKSDPIIKIMENNVLVSYHVLINFMAELNFKKFPLEDHRINIILENKSVTAQELVFESSGENISIAKYILVDTWQPRTMHANAGYVKTKINTPEQETYITYPSVVFSIDFESVGARTPIALYFPLFISFLIVLISLLLKITSDTRLGLAASGVPALVLFRLVIESSSPVAGYSTHIDATYYLITFLSLLILFFQAYMTLILHRHYDEKKEAPAYIISKFEYASAYMFVIMLSALLIGFTLLFL
ncbi:MAG: hypothetical protein US69_C0003G0019 [candidate division TM6 bacterium GW2011_GWF2_38_10]|nr:MAG: hypothetical protein US69_C0003G0019 [candidate division TM6 bacterium GW2011_GWF2_38_10]